MSQVLDKLYSQNFSGGAEINSGSTDSFDISNEDEDVVEISDKAIV